MEEKIGNIILNYNHYCGSDLYSDGEIEDELLEIAKNYDEKNFNNIIAERKSWPIMYHLSHLRGNIVEWLPINNSHSVLEIGSGCGAVTVTLSDKANNVTCIELSEKRSLINAYRNKNRNNIEILLGNFENIENDLKIKYDFITLIGVFEYAGLYISHENPHIIFLNKVRKHLKEHGKIIIAIENKLGLKYWAGCQEDHVGGYYVGIEDNYDIKGIKTFSRMELEDIFKKSDFNNYKFYYPYPDYKLPTSIYSDEYLPKKGELNNNIRNFDRERLITFDETKVFDTIIKENMFQTYSNSFLVILSNERDK